MSLPGGFAYYVVSSTKPSPPKVSGKRRRWLPPLIILAVALSLRLVFLVQFSSFPLFDTNIMDMDYFHRLATEGIPDTGFPSGPYFKAPLYPLFLKLIYSLFGPGPWAPRVIQIALGCLTALMTYLIGARLFSRRVATEAGLLVAVCGTLILYDGQLLDPTLTIAVTLVAMYLLIVGWQSGRLRWLFLAGVFFGLSAIARAVVLTSVGGLALYLLWLKRQELRQAWKMPFCLLIGVATAIAPVTIRNFLESGEFVPIGTYGGINLYIGNNLHSDGVSATVPGTGLDWWHGGVMDDTRRIADTDAGRELSPTEQSVYWRNRALREIRDNPGFFIGHLGRKLLLFLGGYELANNFDIRYVSKRIPLLNYLILDKPVYWPWGIVLPLGIAGMILLGLWCPEQRFLLLFGALYVPSLLLFFVTGRYRLPLIPFLAVFAAYAIDTALTALRQQPVRRVMWAMAVFVALIIVGRLDPFGYASGTEAQGHQMMAALYELRGDQATAEKYYYLALEADPTLPHSHNDLGLMLLHRGEVDKAIEHLEIAAQNQPDEWLIQYNLGLAYKTAGRWSDAINQYQLVLRMAPEMTDASRDLAMTWLQAGYPDSALDIYRRLLKAEPDNYLDYFSVGLCLQSLGQSDSVLWYYRQTLSREPRYPETYFNLGRYWIEMSQPDSATYYLDTFLHLDPKLPDLETEAQRLLDSLRRMSGPQGS